MSSNDYWLGGHFPAGDAGIVAQSVKFSVLGLHATGRGASQCVIVT
ncbi:hypothetical protein ABIC60_003674 [Phyllobacterium ifriqiyense]